jgi:hypothetical protein
MSLHEGYLLEATASYERSIMEYCRLDHALDPTFEITPDSTFPRWNTRVTGALTKALLDSSHYLFVLYLYCLLHLYTSHS